MFNDEYLEYWGTVFVAARLLEQRIAFQEFLADPWECLQAVGLSSAPLCLACGYQPLLPRQRQVAQELRRRWETETGANGLSTPETTPALVAAEESEP